MNKLEDFGKEVITDVLDLTWDNYLMIQSGKMKSDEAQQLHKLWISLNDEDKNKIDTIVKDIITLMLHNTLVMFEESQNFCVVDKNDNEDLNELSDGLAGELYGENGWIEKYSKIDQ